MRPCGGCGSLVLAVFRDGVIYWKKGVCTMIFLLIRCPRTLSIEAACGLVLLILDVPEIFSFLLFPVLFYLLHPKHVNKKIKYMTKSPSSFIRVASLKYSGGGDRSQAGKIETACNWLRDVSGSLEQGDHVEDRSPALSGYVECISCTCAKQDTEKPLRDLHFAPLKSSGDVRSARRRSNLRYR